MRATKQARSRATSERILQSAIELLSNEPFEQISVEDIVISANCSVGAFYKRFSSKMALLPAILELLKEQEAQGLNEFMRAFSSVEFDLASRIEQLINLLRLSYREHKQLVRNIFDYLSEKDRKAYQQDFSLILQEKLASWLMGERESEGSNALRRRSAICIFNLCLSMQGFYLYEATVLDCDEEQFIEEQRRLIHCALT